ncbi:hypothetical protein CL634_02260 [bacterium]|nr:hypothetical protein [bacterium]
MKRPSGLYSHEKNCHLNPKNLKFCPICEQPIKNYRWAGTCGKSCANKHFRLGENSPNWKGGRDYRIICFENHRRECVICGEQNAVVVHHINQNQEDNRPENLLPMCPTHHYYIHSKFRFFIEEKVKKYRRDRWESE